MPKNRPRTIRQAIIYLAVEKTLGFFLGLIAMAVIIIFALRVNISCDKQSGLKLEMRYIDKGILKE